MLQDNKECHKYMYVLGNAWVPERGWIKIWLTEDEVNTLEDFDIPLHGGYIKELSEDQWRWG